MIGAVYACRDQVMDPGPQAVLEQCQLAGCAEAVFFTRVIWISRVVLGIAASSALG